MTEPEVYNLNRAAEIIGEEARLLGILLIEREIPHVSYGPMKLVDRKGLELLKAAAADYRRKAGPVVPRPVRKRLTKRSAAAS